MTYLTSFIPYNYSVSSIYIYVFNNLTVTVFLKNTPIVLVQNDIKVMAEFCSQKSLTWSAALPGYRLARAWARFSLNSISPCANMTSIGLLIRLDRVSASFYNNERGRQACRAHANTVCIETKTRRVRMKRSEKMSQCDKKMEVII